MEEYNLVDFREYFIDKYFSKEWMNNAKQEYNDNDPFPHIVIDNFLPPEILDSILEDFPKPGGMEWWTFNNNNEIKLGSKNEVQIPQIARNVLQELNSGYILDWLEVLTSVPGLVADTRLIGGGLHQIQRGGKLGIHVDFNIESRTKLARKLNLLIYLNKDWNDDWGGHLELWNNDKTQCVQKIAPIFNRCVIFNTTGKPWHGHPHPLNTPDEVTRKSLALYYYNVDNTVTNSHNTIF
jgi:Rps23 Pro-64 3,4-dihydroxylase Tpa1-like proline 4-hydroxylase